MRELAELGERRLRIAAQLLEQRRERLPIAVDELTREPELHGERYEVLLGTVVEIALDLAPRLVRRRNDARARSPQLLVRDAEVVERRLQRGVERRVVQRDRDLAGEVGEHPLFLAAERLLVSLPRSTG